MGRTRPRAMPLATMTMKTQTLVGICARELTQAEAKMINHGIMLNVSTENFTHDRILRAYNTFLTSKNYEFVNVLSGIANRRACATQ